jgi:hypothetical protein
MDSSVTPEMYAQVESALIAAREQQGWELDLAWWKILEDGADVGYEAVGLILGYVVGAYFAMLGTDEREAKERLVLASEAEHYGAGWYSLDGDDFERVVGGLFSVEGMVPLSPFDGPALLIVAAACLRSGIGESALLMAKTVALGEVLA